jgi:phosphoribosylformylglycinamidine (FGAM) synthase-like enzyme
MALASKIGVIVNIPEDHFVHLFSETPGRILIAIESDRVDNFVGRAIDCEITTTKLGKTGGDEINFENLYTSTLKVNTLPIKLFGSEQSLRYQMIKSCITQPLPMPVTIHY